MLSHKPLTYCEGHENPVRCIDEVGQRTEQHQLALVTHISPLEFHSETFKIIIILMYYFSIVFYSERARFM